MDIDIRDIELGTICPYMMYLAEQHEPIPYESDGFCARAAHILDAYYARYNIGKATVRSRLKAMFIEYVEEHYRTEGGDISWLEAETMLFDKFIILAFKLADPTSDVLPRLPVESSIEYNHSVKGYIDAVVESYRRPRGLSIILYANKPIHTGVQLRHSFRLAFYKTVLSGMYERRQLEKAKFQIYSFAPASRTEVALSDVDVPRFRELAGRIATIKALGLFHPCQNPHCYRCQWAAHCCYGPH